MTAFQAGFQTGFQGIGAATYSYTATGGIAFGGVAPSIRSATKAASGGILFSGAASVSFTSAVQSLIVTPIGGIVIGAAAVIVRTCTRLVVGGISFGGTSAVEFFSILSTGASDWIGYIRRRGRR